MEIQPTAPWYHGTNQMIDVLYTGSTITQWRELAEAFSHKPSMLEIGDDGRICHNGEAYGYLYQIDESICVGIEVYPHPRTTMDLNMEFLTAKPLKVKLIQEIDIVKDKTFI